MGTRGSCVLHHFSTARDTALKALHSDSRVGQGNRKAQYLDTLHQFLEAEKHFFVCPGAATPHIPDNPPHSWPVVATCRHLGNGGLTSSLRCIEAKSAVKKTGKYIAKTKCLATLQLLRQFTSNNTKATAHAGVFSLYGFVTLLSFIAAEGVSVWGCSIGIGLEWPHYHNIFPGNVAVVQAEPKFDLMFQLKV